MYSYILSLIIAILLILPAQKSHAETSKSMTGPIKAKVIRIIDGDTIQVEAMIWPGQYIKTYIRINGIDTPEHKGKCEKEKILAKKATLLLKNTIPDAQPILLYNVKNGKFAGRVVADIKTINGISIAKTMLDEGVARPYDGKKKRQPWCGKSDV